MRKVAVLSLVLALGLSMAVFAAIPRLINYQGRLTDSSDTPLEGSQDITFRIYDAQSGGNLLWEETQSVLIQKGVFSIFLGGTTDLNLAFDKPYWLAIKVGSDSEMVPRQQIASSGYAIRSEAADSAVNAQTADMADDTQKIVGKNIDTPTSADSGDVLTYNHSNSKYEHTSKTTFGSWVSKSNNTVYQATTDGFVIAWSRSGADRQVEGLSDGSNSPATTRIKMKNSGGGSGRATITMPVKKGDYWKVLGADDSVFWIPLGR